jgi:adenylate cyclase
MQRKLAAIISADVVGYSSLMEADEAGTLERLKQNRRSIVDPHVAKHGGRIIKLMGDGALIEFSSVVAAVECAIAVQAAMASAPDQSIRYRIGVNLGDVIIEGDDIYGEGVNVAARVQTLAPEGGVAISRTVRDHIEGKVAATFQDIGEHAVKNIQRPVHVFTLGPPAAAERRHGNRVSICVLPFANMSGDLEQEYFSDGISEDIITDLSKVSALAVTARNTAFTFKGKHVDVPQVARQLQVAHVLEGSVRKAGNRVRITAQLIDGKTGDHVWAERYDRDLSDIFAMQDEISEAIVKVLKVRLLPEEKKEIERRGTSDPEAYKLYLMARQMWATGNMTSPRNAEAIARLCGKAVEIDPNYAAAWALMARVQGTLRIQSGTGDTGLAAADRAIALDPQLADGRAARALALRVTGKPEEALVEAEISVRLDPQSYEANLSRATCFYVLGRLPEAIPYYEKALALMETSFAAAGMLASCYKGVNDKDGERRAATMAVASAEKAIAADPGNGYAMGFIANCLAQLGEAQRAKAWAERAILLDPENLNMRYNFACAFAQMHETDTALDLLEPVFAKSYRLAAHAKNDPDFVSIREHPRFKAMIAAAEARIAQRDE